MKQDGSTSRARLIFGAVAAATLVAAAAWIFAERGPEARIDTRATPHASKANTQGKTGDAHKDASASASGSSHAHGRDASKRDSAENFAHSSDARVDGASAAEDPAVAGSAEINEREWLPNPAEDFGPEDAAFEERYGEPTPELIRDSFASAFQQRFPERDLSPEEEQRAADALVRMRQLRLEMRGLPFTQANADERQALLSEYQVAVTEIESTLEIPIIEFTQDPPPLNRGGPEAIQYDDSSDLVFPGSGGGLDHDWGPESELRNDFDPQEAAGQ
ncbi:MAG: hypothetical protein AB8G23_10560 [Myxococcota bacterium]